MAPMAPMAPMATVTSMAEQVHGDEGDADQDPQPVCHEPLHFVSPSNCVVDDGPNAGLDEMPIAVVRKVLCKGVCALRAVP